MSTCKHILVFDRDTSSYCKLCGMIVAPPQLFSKEQWGTLKPISDASLITEKMQTYYKRKTRFMERLRNLCGDSDIAIPHVVHSCIDKEMFKYGIAQCDLQPTFVSFALKKHKFMRYHEQAIRLAAIHGDFKPLTISCEATRQMKLMFRQCDELWDVIRHEIYKSHGWVRLTFPNYTIFIYNFLILLGEHKASKYVSQYVLKTKALIHRQQYLWKIFCQKLKWVFIPMVGNAFATQDLVARSDLLYGKPKTLHLKFGGACY